MLNYVLWAAAIATFIVFGLLLNGWLRNRRFNNLWKETCTYARLHHLDQEMLKDKSLETIKNFCDAQFRHPHLSVEAQIKMKELKQAADRLSK